MGDSAIAKGLDTYHRRRDAAWSFMVATAQRHHVTHRPITAAKMQRGFNKETYGVGLRDIAGRFGVKTKTIHTLHSILALLIDVAEKNGSTHAEVFERYGNSFELAAKRTLHCRVTYNPWHRKARMAGPSPA
jgi:hypothetical protein